MEMMNLKSTIAIAVCCVCTIPGWGAPDSETTTTEFKPTLKINGQIRARGEMSLVDDEEGRFQVRNARVTAAGNVAPSISYKAELDLCDRGAVKVTDVWARVGLGAGFAVQAGQMRMPFTFGSTRAPYAYLFANRPFVDKQFIGPRNAGVKLIYNCPRVPLTIEGGMFNATSLTNHGVWQKRFAYAAKALYTLSNVKLIAGFESLSPSTVRINHINGGINWTCDRWMIEGEYIYKHYTNKTFSAAHAWSVMADYGMPVKVGDFNRLSFQGRWDGMTDNSNGQDVVDGKLSLTNHACNRATVGTMLSYVVAKVRADVKINYEHYFYHHGVTPDPSNDNMVVAELVVRF